MSDDSTTTRSIPKGWKLTTHRFRPGGSVFDRDHTHEACLDERGGNGCYRACGFSLDDAIRRVLEAHRTKNAHVDWDHYYEHGEGRGSRLRSVA